MSDDLTPGEILAATAITVLMIVGAVAVAAQVVRLWTAGLHSTAIVGASMFIATALVLVCVGGAE